MDPDREVFAGGGRCGGAVSKGAPSPEPAPGADVVDNTRPGVATNRGGRGTCGDSSVFAAAPHPGASRADSSRSRGDHSEFREL